MVAEVRHTPADGHEQAARPGNVSLFDVLEREPELVARGGQVPARRGGQPGGDDLVVERRHDDLDAVVGGVANAGDDVLLQRRGLRHRRPGERNVVEERQERRTEHRPAHPTGEHASREPLLPVGAGERLRHGPFYHSCEPVPSDAAMPPAGIEPAHAV